MSQTHMSHSATARRVAVGLLLLGGSGGGTGCGDDPPVAPPPPDSTVYQTVNFAIVDYAGLPAAVIDTLGARLETEFAGVAAILVEVPPPGRIVARILVGSGLPFVTPDDNSLTLWSDSLTLDYIPHQLTHLFTRYRQREFLEEGLAVYVTELRVPDSKTVHPYRGQPSHAWMSLFLSYRSAIPLLTAYFADNLGFDSRGSTFDASSWQLFLEGGSFVRWVVETYGWAEWWDLYRVDQLEIALGAPPSALEVAWFNATVSQFPTPLECEAALGAVGRREEFWCARARGE